MPPKKTTRTTGEIPKMRFYDETQTRDIRVQLEKEVLKWPGVNSKPMMGCLCYFNGKKFFAFLVTKGIVLTRLPEEVRTELSRAHGGHPFEMSGKSVKAWVRVPLPDPSSVKSILPFLRQSYEATQKEPSKRDGIHPRPA